MSFSMYLGFRGKVNGQDLVDEGIQAFHLLYSGQRLFSIITP